MTLEIQSPQLDISPCSYQCAWPQIDINVWSYRFTWPQTDISPCAYQPSLVPNNPFDSTLFGRVFV